MKPVLMIGVAGMALLSAPYAMAQHADHQPTPATAAPADPHAAHHQPSSAPDPHAGHARQEDHGGNGSPMAPATDAHAVHGGAGMRGFLGPYPMAREASGTAWQPEAGGGGMGGGVHTTSGEWMWMGHALLNGVYTDQGGRRGDSQGFASGMVMGMGQRPLVGGTLGVRVMVSPDPFMGGRGYPLLLAAGETADGVNPLIDRQHPHELISEIALTYSVPLGARASAFAYMAPVGEPAFGPPAFPHRASGLDNPLAPISHHWLDSTHISFGVLTGGVVLGDLKLEGSGFRGREPDQDRYDVEAPRLDSWAVRATWNPTPEWSLQVSRAEQRSPEQLEPDVDVTRTSASVAYGRGFEAWLGGGAANATLAWGRRSPTHGESLDAWLAEGALSFNSGWTVFARAERIETNELTGDHHDPAYRVGELTLGVIRDWQIRPGVRVGIGGAVQAYDVPAGLEPSYGGDPTGVTAFVRLRAM